MSAHQGFRVAATTTGIASSPFEHLRVDYVYGGDKHDDEPFSPSMAESSADRKRRRLEKLAELDAADPPPTLAAAARQLEVSEKTARSYRAELARNRKAGP